MRHSGQCHCGTVAASFDTAKTPTSLGVRSCQCAFCQRHGALNVSDPEGCIEIDAAADDVIRYRFALKTADFLICRHCGVYVAAVSGRGEAIVSTINIVGLAMAGFADAPLAPMDYEAETTEDRVARRNAKWTPTKFLNPELAAAHFGPH